MAHPDVVEVAVVSVPDEARGQLVKAFVVLSDAARAGLADAAAAGAGACAGVSGAGAGAAADAATAQAEAAKVKELQDFVKAEIAPYKYPRAIEFIDGLPRTSTGKLQRFRLRSHEGVSVRSSRVPSR